MLLVGGNDALNQRVADDIALGELNNRDTFGVFQRLVRLNEPGPLLRREIHLGFVASDDGF
jgi:hypothetical protein